jgi:hypothetical protein
MRGQQGLPCHLIDEDVIQVQKVACRSQLLYQCGFAPMSLHWEPALTRIECLSRSR